MCLQDYQLARAVLKETFEFVTTGAVNGLMLPSNPQRVGVLIAGPNTGNLDILTGASASRRTIARIQLTTTDISRHINLLDFGLQITEELYYNASAAIQWTVFEYSLPFDPVSLKRLAELGKW